MSRPLSGPEEVPGSSVRPAQHQLSPTSPQGFRMGLVEMFDRVQALEQIDGDHAFLEQLIELFLADVPDRVEALRIAMGIRNGRGLRNAAHSLKGALGCLGAVRAANAAMQLEEAARQEDFISAAPRLTALENELGSLVAELSRELNAEPRGNTSESRARP